MSFEDPDKLPTFKESPGFWITVPTILGLAFWKVLELILWAWISIHGGCK